MEVNTHLIRRTQNNKQILQTNSEFLTKQLMVQKLMINMSNGNRKKCQNHERCSEMLIIQRGKKEEK